MPEVQPLSPKALQSICNTGYLNVWEGAVRSAKTVASELAWIDYVANSPESTFIMSGRSQGSLHRNVIGGDFGLLAMLGVDGDYKVDREGNRILTIKTPRGPKRCYCFGANDDRSYGTLRGLTAGGWYADEINMHARSFVEEAFRRTIVSRDRKHLWTLNPDNPNHYIYAEYLDPYEEKCLPGFYLWKFYLEDNLAISDQRKAELRAQYAGVFYRRYILGERCVAEGVIFDMLTEENYYTQATRPLGLEYTTQRFTAIDHGTKAPCGFLDAFDDGATLWIDNEYYYDSDKAHARKTDEEYVADYLQFIGGEATEFPPQLTVDPEAAPFIESLKRAGFLVKLAKKDVLSGIAHLTTLFKLRRIKINKDRCPHLIKELSGYAWDEKAAKLGEEKPVKQNDHLCDPLRYLVETFLLKWRYGE
jgi:PBSX family phage terminase large subunit